MFFASDNASPAHPLVMDALNAANTGYTMPYGADALMENVRTKIRDVFDAPDAEVYLVATGTAANSIALATLCPPWSTIFAHRNAHIEEDECGAPEFFTGGSKITLIDGADAKMDPASLNAALGDVQSKGVHGVQRGVLSLTNVTEAGTVYTTAETAALTSMAKSYGLPTHLDGARFANAVVATGQSPADLTWKAGIDAVSFGGTKNGLMGVEAVVFFDPKHAWEFELRRKRGGHLFSKHRYLSAQMLAYLTDDLWLETATKSNAAAARLCDGLRDIDGTTFLHPSQANIVFAGWSRAAHKRLQEAKAAYYLWPFNQSLDGPDDETLTARLVCSWTTTDNEVDQFLDIIRG